MESPIIRFNSVIQTFFALQTCVVFFFFFFFRKVSCPKLGDGKPGYWSFMHEKVNNVSKRVDLFFSLRGGKN